MSCTWISIPVIVQHNMHHYTHKEKETITYKKEHKKDVNKLYL